MFTAARVAHGVVQKTYSVTDLRKGAAHRYSPAAVVAVLGIADRVWTVGDLLDAALATQPIDPVVTAPDRRRLFRVIKGGVA